MVPFTNGGVYANDSAKQNSPSAMALSNDGKMAKCEKRGRKTEKLKTFLS